MPPTSQITYLLASHEPAFLAAVEPVLVQSGGRVHIVLSADAAQSAFAAPARPDVALIDCRLPGLDLGRLLATAHAHEAPRLPTVLFSDTISEELQNRLDESMLDDVVPVAFSPAHLAVRLNLLQRALRRDREIDSLRGALARNNVTDSLTGVYTRAAILSLLFRETDRVQRMNTQLSLILFDLDDFGHWNAQLGTGACDQLLVQVAERVTRLLRSYDQLGRVGKDEFLAALPGCSAIHAVQLAERICAEVFAAPFSVTDTAVRLTACFGVAPSHGRSPVVVLREAEEALRRAREAGPESVRFHDRPGPAAFFAQATGDDRRVG